jgi:deoxyadenosine/deoxycytidine kinase
MYNKTMTHFEVTSIDGNIGSGKSTLMKNLHEYYKDEPNVVFLREPVDEWEKVKDENGVTMLEKFYEDPEKYAFSFQMMAYVSRLKVFKDAIKNINTSEKVYIITERSLYTDKMVFAKMLYDSNKIEHINYQIYLNWFNMFSEEFPVHKIVYVKTSPEKCHYRILKRSRDGEGNIPLEYLDNCSKYHNDMLDKSSSDCVCHDQLVLDGNINIYDNENQIQNWIDEIKNFIKK